MRPWIVLAALSLLWISEASGQALSALEPPPVPVRDGRVGFAVEERGMRLGAELAVSGVSRGAERAKVQPRLASALAVGRLLRLETRLGLPDLNGGIETAQATMDSKLRVRPRVPVVRGVDTHIRRTGNGTSTNTSIELASPLSFVNALEGRIRQAANGASTYSVTLGFSKAAWAGATGNGRLSSEAIIEQTVRPGRDDGHRVGFQAVLQGSRRDTAAGASFRPGTEAYKLVLGLEQRYAGAQAGAAASLALNQSWLVRPVSTIGLSMKLSHSGAETRRSVEVAWQAGF